MPSDLDFISRPNPVEPSALNNGNLSRTTNEHLMPFLLNSRVSQQRRDVSFEMITKPPPPRQSDQTPPSSSSGLPIANVLNKDESTKLTPPRSDQSLYTLPKLPVKRGTKRHRVPPVLQGLHEPPPTSRILPSISAEETQVLLPSTRNSRNLLNDVLFPDKEVHVISIAEPAAQTEPKPAGNRPAPDKLVPQRNKWTDQETEDLLLGVARFGIGSWKKILMCPEYSFNKRTAVDLKDRFRVCKPNAYGKPRTKKAKEALKTKAADGDATTRPSDDNSHGPADCTQKSALVRDIDAKSQAVKEAEGVLWKVKRRKRRRFTAEEDEALLRGYEEHGASWQSIQKDPVFQSNSRTPTDLRDRFRTKFPEHYVKAGLVPRPANFPKPLPRSGAAGDEDNKQSENSTPKDDAITTAATAAAATAVPTTGSRELLLPLHKTSPTGPSWYGGAGGGVGNMAKLMHRPHGLPLPRIADNFVPDFDDFHHGGGEDGDNYDEDEEDRRPLVLDRSIVDWANTNMPSSMTTSARLPPPYIMECGSSGGGGGMLHPDIDPRATLKPPNSTGQF